MIKNSHLIIVSITLLLFGLGYIVFDRIQFHQSQTEYRRIAQAKIICLEQEHMELYHCKFIFSRR